MDIWRAEPDVEEIAKEIINEHRTDLKETHIVYIFKEKAGKKSGKVTIATARKAYLM